MKTTALTIAWTLLAAILHLSLFALLLLLLAYAGAPRLFRPPDSAETIPWLHLAAGCVFTCLPSFLTGLILARIREAFRPVAAAFLGGLVFWIAAWHFGVCTTPFVVVAGAGLAALGSIAGAQAPHHLWTRSRIAAQCLFGILVLLNAAMVYVVTCYDIQ